MRAFVVFLAVLLSVPPVTLALAQGAGTAPSGKAPDGLAQGLADETLDQLFATLAKPADDAEGHAAEAEIERRWLKSGSDTVDLLMDWSAQSIRAKDYGRALDFLDAVVVLRPGYAEGWNRRATVFYMRDEYGKAIADIEKVLALQPRHFGALAALGLILREIDRKADALAALEKAVAINPYLDSDVSDAIKELKPDVDGKEI